MQNLYFLDPALHFLFQVSRRGSISIMMTGLFEKEENAEQAAINTIRLNFVGNELLERLRNFPV